MPRLRVAGVVLALASLPLAGCKEVETETATGYEPAKIQEVKGNPDVKQVTFTAEGAQRTGLKTTAVRRDGRHEVVPYESLIYDAEGKTYVYTNPKPLTFLRVPVQVDRIEGNRVVLTKGPAARTAVVTVGAAEVYGTELEIAGSH
jgi:hypothetical protein